MERQQLVVVKWTHIYDIAQHGQMAREYIYIYTWNYDCIYIYKTQYIKVNMQVLL